MVKRDELLEKFLESYKEIPDPRHQPKKFRFFVQMFLKRYGVKTNDRY